MGLRIASGSARRAQAGITTTALRGLLSTRIAAATLGIVTLALCLAINALRSIPLFLHAYRSTSRMAWDSATIKAACCFLRIP